MTTTTLLWIARILVAVVFTATGMTKLISTREKLAPKVHWVATWPRGGIKLLGVAEVAGALGLVLPAATGIAPFLTPIAAVCLGVLMAGAIRTHRQLGEGFLPAATVGVFCLVIAVGSLR
jgi:uncharacterized membrane protein YphA (DoxX/SURF4 family)